MLKNVSAFIMIMAIGASITRIAQCTPSNDESKHSTSIHDSSPLERNASKPRQLQTQVLTITSVADDPRKGIASLHCEDLMRHYLATSLSPVAGVMFAPVSYHIALSSMVNEPIDERGNTLLHLASRDRDPFFTWLLLGLGADTSVRNRSFKQPIDFLRPGIAEADKFLFSALIPISPWSENMTAVPYDGISGKSSRIASGGPEDNTSPDRPAVI